MGLESLIQQEPGSDGSEWKVLDANGTVRLRRQIRINQPGRQIDVFGEGWGVTLAHPFEKPIVSAIVKGKPVRLVGKRIACYFPPRSIVEWALDPGDYSFEGIFCNATLPDGLPESPVAFETGCSALPQSPTALLDFVRAAKNPISILKEDIVSAPARRMKSLIEQTFLESVPIAEIAQKIGFNHATIIRAFTKAYGMTPVRYRSKLRVYFSIRDIVSGSQISAAAGNSGYHDLSQYNRQFKREMSHSPSVMKPAE